MARDLFISATKIIGKNHPTFIIAEIGQNHQGNIDTAKILIEMAKVINNKRIWYLFNGKYFRKVVLIV